MMDSEGARELSRRIIESAGMDIAKGNTYKTHAKKFLRSQWAEDLADLGGISLSVIRKRLGMTA